jgi:hypothetical protein
MSTPSNSTSQLPTWDDGNSTPDSNVVTRVAVASGNASKTLLASVIDSTSGPLVIHVTPPVSRRTQLYLHLVNAEIGRCIRCYESDYQKQLNKTHEEDNDTFNVCGSQLCVIDTDFERIRVVMESIYACQLLLSEDLSVSHLELIKFLCHSLLTLEGCDLKLYNFQSSITCLCDKAAEAK